MLFLLLSLIWFGSFRFAKMPIKMMFFWDLYHLWLGPHFMKVLNGELQNCNQFWDFSPFVLKTPSVFPVLSKITIVLVNLYTPLVYSIFPLVSLIWRLLIVLLKFYIVVIYYTPLHSEKYFHSRDKIRYNFTYLLYYNRWEFFRPTKKKIN